MKKKVLLVILDGWGLATDPAVSAIDKAHTPYMDALYKVYSHSTLEASGLAVGLPEGQMGNSEVGHINIGAGRVVYQTLARINKAVADKELYQNAALLKALEYVSRTQKKLHLIGLVSDGGVHSHTGHLKELCSVIASKNIPGVFIHAFTDGRDTDPRSGLASIKEVQAHIEGTGIQIASVTGRYYAMDRDKRWERVKTAFDALVNAKGDKYTDAAQAIADSYANGVTDEFIRPCIMTDAEGAALAKIEPGDAVLCFNFRTDRCREITEALSQQDFPDYGMHAIPLHFTTMTQYDDTFKNVNVMFDKDALTNTLGEVISKAGKEQIRIAETEKYPHVTFFFSGGQETPFEGESRIMCPSPKVATYDLQPEMSADVIRDRIILEIRKKTADFICLNFANADMVGHTGVFKAAVHACETVDVCAESVIEVALENDYCALLIADHGNSDCMINPDGSPNTAHTTNLVPCVLIDNDFKPPFKNGKLCDVAPTILKLMGIDIPEEMTGEPLF